MTDRFRELYMSGRDHKRPVYDGQITLYMNGCLYKGYARNYYVRARPDVRPAMVTSHGADFPRPEPMRFAEEIDVTFIVEERTNYPGNPEFTVDDHLREIQQHRDNDVLIPKEELWTVQKHLDAIKEIQNPKQKELREKARKQKQSEEFAKLILV